MLQGAAERHWTVGRSFKAGLSDNPQSAIANRPHSVSISATTPQRYSTFARLAL
jgi:hypothetical protein